MSAIPSTMRAVRFNGNAPIDDASSFEDIVVPVPSVFGHDILVQVKAVSVNPLDVLLRTAPPFFQSVATNNKHNVLGYDAAGVVVALGPDASLFKVGDEVYYAGTWVRDGTNAEYHAVDKRIVDHKPQSLSFADAAALPLTTITAYESIFHRLQVPAKSEYKKSVLVLNGAGGVGSIVIQLLKELTDVTVTATASRPQSSKWVKELGADFIVNHAQDIPSQLKDIGIPQVDYVLAYTELVPYFDTIIDVIKPQGKICSVSPPAGGLAFDKLFFKSVTVVWEVMFTRAIFTTDDIEEQHRLLNHASELIDAKKVRSTVGENLGLINAANLKKAHAALESHRVVGKLVLSGF
ncbi:unnamed protein product [Aphanomyces euteiches]|uniref:Enoyl reductase (ER) domain-containing protein n=1 Tax=Aphanomyces euteiches TaxID=100861 RepID=A0A6G0WLV0_9STRA|nr:hypothetical protein Ae201684_013912 [Aphanomyces euteiches]KAH9082934.1 hypothetical protein Ae201684P_013837 [Aphanomyces euteiches]KAH9150632.1 hypothetical protein AeRB84_006562 [Aphanomyces euteiches]